MKAFLKPFVFVLLVLGCNTLKAQKKFTGYYINIQGDSIAGEFARYKQWSTNPSEVEFVGEHGNRILLTPANCSLFSVTGYDTYIAYSGPRLINLISDIAVYDNRALITEMDSTEKVSVFLRLVIHTNAAALYELKDNKRVNFFYREPGKSITELRYKKYYSQGSVVEMDEYRNQLYTSFALQIHAQHLSNTLEKLPYAEDDLAGFLKKLFRAPSSVATENAVKHRKSKWLIAAGMSLNFVDRKPDENFVTVPDRYSSGLGALITIAYKTPLDRNFGRYFIQPQLQLFNYNSTGSVPQGTLVKEINYKSTLASVLHIDCGINVVNKEKLAFFTLAGVGIGCQFNAKVTEQQYTASDHEPFGAPIETRRSSLFFSVNAEAGLVLDQKFLLSAQYIAPAIIANYFDYRVRLSALQLKLGYCF